MPLPSQVAGGNGLPGHTARLTGAPYRQAQTAPEAGQPAASARRSPRKAQSTSAPASAAAERRQRDLPPAPGDEAAPGLRTYVSRLRTARRASRRRGDQRRDRREEERDEDGHLHQQAGLERAEAHRDPGGP